MRRPTLLSPPGAYVGPAGDGACDVASPFPALPRGVAAPRMEGVPAGASGAGGDVALDVLDALPPDDVAALQRFWQDVEDELAARAARFEP